MTLLNVVLILALVATIGVLAIGIGSMMRGRDFDQQHSHQLMFTRVGLHAVVVLLIAIAIYLASSSQ